MSYILDALRKSEKERQQGRIPNPLTVHETPPESPKSLYRMKLSACLIVFAVVSAVTWLSLSEQKKQPLVPSTKTDVSDVLKAPSEFAPKISAVAQDVSQRPVNTAKTKTVMEKQKQNGKDASGSQASSEKIRDFLREMNAIKNPPSLPKEREESVPPSVTPSSSGAAPELPRPAAGTLAIQTPPSDPDRIYSLTDLPASIRQNMPNITVTSLMYSHADPASSLIRINGQQLRNGQDNAQGIRVLEILPNGVLLSYQGYRLKINLE